MCQWFGRHASLDTNRNGALTIHFDDTPLANAAVMRPLGLEGVAPPAQALSLPLRRRRLIAVLSVRCRIVERDGIGRNGARVRRHRLKVRADGEHGDHREC